MDNPISNIAVSNNVATTQAGNSYNRIMTAGNTLIKTGAGVLHSINITNGVVGSSAIFYDGTSAAGTIIVGIDTAVPNCYIFDIAFTVGLFVANAVGGANVITSYK